MDLLILALVFGAEAWQAIIVTIKDKALAERTLEQLYLPAASLTILRCPEEVADKRVTQQFYYHQAVNSP